MAENSGIGWTHHTANLWWGCQEVSPGCDNCYARELDKRYGGDHWKGSARKPIKSVWKDLHKFQKNAAAAGEVQRVFVGSMMDIFELSKPLTMPVQLPNGNDAYDTGTLRRYFLEQLVPASPNLLFLLLTKRPSNINNLLPLDWHHRPPANVMFGCSPVTQETADRDIPKLLAVRGHRFLSMEPLLECVHLTPYLDDIDWVIVGGESGSKARPFNVSWPGTLIVDCQRAQVPIFVKQLGAKPFAMHASGAQVPIKLRDGHGANPEEWESWLRVQQFPAHYTPEEVRLLCAPQQET